MTTPQAAATLGDLGSRGAQSLDAIRTEAIPVLLARDDDRSLEVAERQDVLAGLIVEADIDHLVFQPSLVESPLGCGALDASWLGVNGDHIRANLLYRAARMDGVCGVLTALRLHTCHNTHNP